MTIYYVLNLLLQPFTLLGLLTIMALALLWHRRRETRRRLLPLTLVVCVLLVLCVPAVAHLAMASLEWRYPSLIDRPGDADAIVVLAGGASYQDAAHRQVELGTDTLHRCAEAAALYHRGEPCPVVVSGGTPYPRTPVVARHMRDFLPSACAVRPSHLIVEERPQTTFESTLEVRALIAERHFGKIILVTESVHMERSLRCFPKQGIAPSPLRVITAPARSRGTLSRFLSTPTAAVRGGRAFHAWLGIPWYRLQGRL